MVDSAFSAALALSLVGHQVVRPNFTEVLQESLPAGVSLLPANGVQAFRVGGAARGNASVTIVPVSGQSFKEALLIHVTARAPTPWSVQLQARTVAPVREGDACLATFWVRAAGSAAEAVTTMIFEEAHAPYGKSVSYQVTASSSWRQIKVPFVTKGSYPAGGGQVNFQLGFRAQSLEIGGVAVVSYGKRVPLESLPATKLTYEGREPSAAWRKDAQKRIENLRKAKLVVLVKDMHGRPIPGARVHVAMTRHAFPFGAAVAADEILGQGPDNERYRRKIVEMFNRVVIENSLKWPRWQSDPGEAIRAVRWLRSKNMEVRGHNLVWPSWRYLPKDVQSLRGEPALLSKRIDNHIRDEVGRLEGQIVEWDVINEPYANQSVMDVLGDTAMVGWFEVAHDADPRARLFVNDFGILSAGGDDTAHQDGYAKTIAFLVKHDAPLDGIGIESHFGSSLTSPTRVLSILDRFGEFHKKIEITELDISTEDENLQADYLRDFMTVAFSHPSVDGIMLWGFWAGRDWKPEAALFRKDWSIRPSGREWMDLVFHRWWTDMNVETNANGQASVRGFLGSYNIIVQVGGQTKTTSVVLTKTGTTASLEVN